jgi:hypothetical protein
LAEVRNLEQSSPPVGTRPSKAVDPDRRQSRRHRSIDVTGQAVADHRRSFRPRIETSERVTKDRGFGLTDADLTGNDDDVEEPPQA